MNCTMKRMIIYAMLGVAVGASGCKKYLEKEPDNRAKLTDPKKVSQLLPVRIHRQVIWRLMKPCLIMPGIKVQVM